MAKCHDHRISRNIKIIYILMIILWFIVITYFNFWQLRTFPILLLPFILFIIGIYNSDSLTKECENEMFKISFLSVGVIVVIPLLSWISKDYNGDIKQFIAIIVLAMVSTLLSLIDVWIPPDSMSVYKHVKSSLQVISITLLIFGLITYFIHRPHAPLP